MEVKKMATNDNFKMNCLTTELLKAVEKLSLDGIQTVLDKGADIDRQGILETTEQPIFPLGLACKQGDLELVQFLVKSGANLATQDEVDGKSVLHYLCESDDRRDEKKDALLKILDYLIKQGVDINSQDKMGLTPLILACEADDVHMVKIFICAGCDVNLQTNSGDSPLKVACRNAKFWSFWHGRDYGNSPVQSYPNKFPPIQITKLLLQANADVSQATLLPTAVQFNDAKLVKDFLELGMNVNKLDDNMCTPLGSACMSANVNCEVVKLLLDHGADVNKGGGWKKQKPLIFAYVHNSVDKIRLLLSYGAKLTSDEITELVSLSFSKSILENPEIVSLSSKELMSWKLLLSAGFQPMVNQNLLGAKLNQLSMCSSYDKISPWIPTLLFPLRTLKGCCRIVIRNQISPCIDRKIEELPLPRDIKRFLRFEEFTLRETCTSVSPNRNAGTQQRELEFM